MYADGGSIVVRSKSKGIKRRISVPDWRERMDAVAIYGIHKDGSENAHERDIYAEAVRLMNAMQTVLKEAEAQGDVTDIRVQRELLAELTRNPKYTMKPRYSA